MVNTKNSKNVQWLTQNGGPAVKLIMMKNGIIDKNVYDVNELADEMLQLDRLKKSLAYFDQFLDYESYTVRDLCGYIHNCYENCFEVFAKLFLRIGFCKGITVFDEKMSIMRNVYNYLMKTHEFQAFSIISTLISAGYLFEDMEPYIIKKIDRLHRTAKLGDYDFYETDINNIRRPNRWKDKLILKDKFVTDYILPTSYDMDMILEYCRVSGNAEAKQKTEEIMAYLRNPKYQDTYGDYGWHWAEREKTYHASSPGCPLPMYGKDLTEPKENQKWNLLHVLEMLSLSPVMVKSESFEKTMNYLRRFETAHGTFRFPDEYMLSMYVRPFDLVTVCKSFISKSTHDALKKTVKKSFLSEVCSTLVMVTLEKAQQEFK
ncbi:MAG: hypothetical protein LBS21_11165 [Clostridiales bacterium]|jgi:hypothetical protein|nr:hypothetical protein [Clostridiales bacterium]